VSHLDDDSDVIGRLPVITVDPLQAIGLFASSQDPMEIHPQAQFHSTRYLLLSSTYLLIQFFIIIEVVRTMMVYCTFVVVSE